jgi:CO/xanthine dehydrogenase Mo-binding subunit
MLRAKVLRSPYPHARILSVDTRRAAQLPGVECVLTREDLAGTDGYFGSVVRDQPIVAIDRVRYVGDMVAAIASTELDVAEEALDLIEVEYEPLAAVLDPLLAMNPASPAIHDRPLARPDHFKDPNLYRYQVAPNVLMSFRVSQGDVARGFEMSDDVFEDTYTTPVVQHAHMEPHAATAYWDAAGTLVVYTPCQNPWVVHDQLAALFGLPGSQVRVIATPIGGGYGAKTHPRLEPLVAVMSRKSGRPVQLVLTREEVFATAVRHASVVKIRTGVRRDGTLLARSVETIYDTGAYAHTGPMTTKSGGIVSSGPYRIENLDLTAHCVYTNKPPAGPFRGFGVPQVCWAYEQQMDDIAVRLGIDAVELRRRNLIHEGDAFVSGQPLVSIGIDDCLTAVERAIEWKPGLLNQDDDDTVKLCRQRPTECGWVGRASYIERGDGSRCPNEPRPDRRPGAWHPAPRCKGNDSRYRSDTIRHVDEFKPDDLQHGNGGQGSRHADQGPASGDRR